MQSNQSKRRTLAILAAVVVSAGMAHGQAASSPVFNPLPGFDKSVMDLNADPCTDFYQYACGNYAKQHPIPSDQASFGQFDNLYEVNAQQLRGIVEKAAAGGAGTHSNDQKIGDYYSSCLDTDAIEKKGLAPIQPELDRINAIKSKDELPAELGLLQKMKVGAFINFGSQQDYKDATKEIADLTRAESAFRRRTITSGRMRRAKNCASSTSSTWPMF